MEIFFFFLKKSGVFFVDECEAMQKSPTIRTILQDWQFYSDGFCLSEACQIANLLSLSHNNVSAFKRRRREKKSLTCGNSENSVLSQRRNDFPGTERAARSPSLPFEGAPTL